MTKDPARSVGILGAPEIPGLAFRLISVPRDYQNIVDIFTASSAEDGLDYSDTVDDVAKYYSNLANCDPERDILFIEVKGKAVGYTRIWHMVRSDRPGYIFQYFIALVPEWRGRGIREAVLSWCEKRILEKSAGLPPESTKEILLWVYESEKEWRAVLDASGYRVIRYGFRMVRPTLDKIPDCPLPPGIEIRPVTPDQHRKIWDADLLASNDGWLQLRGEEEWFENWTSSRLFQPDLWQVAWDGDRVAGAVQNYIDTEENARFNRKRGWTENIHVGKEWRGRGIAKALIARSFAVLKEKGMTEAALGVDAMNPTGALHLYKKMGFVEEMRSFTYRKDVVGIRSGTALSGQTSPSTS